MSVCLDRYHRGWLAVPTSGLRSLLFFAAGEDAGRTELLG